MSTPTSQNGGGGGEAASNSSINAPRRPATSTGAYGGQGGSSLRPHVAVAFAADESMDNFEESDDTDASPGASLGRPLLGPRASTSSAPSRMQSVSTWLAGLVRAKRSAQQRLAARRSYASGAGSTISPLTPLTSVPEDANGTTPLGQPSATPSRLSHLDRMTISPFDKFRRFGRVPVKFVLALGVVLSLTCFYIVQNLQTAAYIDGTTTTLRTLLGNPLSDDQTPAGGTILRTAPELRDHLQTAAQAYFILPNTSVCLYTVEKRIPITWTNTSGTYSDYLTLDNPLGPMQDLDDYPLARWLQAVSFMTVEFFLETQQFQVEGATAIMDAKYRWHITGTYALGASGSRAEYRLRLSITLLDESQPTLIALNALVIAFALPSLLLTLKALYKSWFAYNYARKHLSRLPKDENDLVWSRLNCQDKLAFFNLWHITSSIGDLLLVLGSCMTFSRQLGMGEDDQDSLSPSDVLHALGGFLAWISLLKFYEWNAELYMLMLSIKASMKRVLNFILTVSPVYIAYAIVGVGCFYDHPDYFGNIFKSSRTIFALINGDSILFIFQELQKNTDMGYLIVGQIYLYSLLTVFILTVMNLFAFIIETGYQAAIHAVYGHEEQLQVAIDHERLRMILQAAQASDPDRTGVVMTDDWEHFFPLEEPASPPIWRRVRRGRRHRHGHSSSSSSSSSDDDEKRPARPRSKSEAAVSQPASTSSSARLIGLATGDNAVPLTTRKPVASVSPDPATARRTALMAEIQQLQTMLSSKINELATLT